MKKKLTVWLNDGNRLQNPPARFGTAWKNAIREYGLKGRAGESTLVLDGPEPSMIIGIGADDPSRAVYEAAIRAVSAARLHKFAALELGGTPKDLIQPALRGLADADYSFKVTSKPKARTPLKSTCLGAKPDQERLASVLGESVRFAKDLVNASPGEKFPDRIARRVSARLSKISGVRIETWNEKRLSSEKCRGILAVGRGSANPPRAMILRYRPAGAKKMLGLVGKGVTFDAGGLNIKTYEGMKTMKCDMSGAAGVIAAFEAISRLKMKISVTAWIGFAENMLGPDAFKPGDVITMRSGKTVEVLNTDAEGRIVLGDLLDLAANSPANHVVNMATLTGACLVALGDETAGLFSNDDKLAGKIAACAEATGESVWRMPLGRDYLEKIKGDVSDLKNVGGRHGGSCTAAQFLKEFVGKKSWAHLDIAGPAFREGGRPGRPAGGTGFGAATLVELASSL